MTDVVGYELRVEEAMRSTLPAERVEELAADPHPTVREAVAWRVDVPLDLRLRLACDENTNVSGPAAAWLRSCDDAGCQLVGALAGPGMGVDELLALVASSGVESRLLGV